MGPVDPMRGIFSAPPYFGLRAQMNYPSLAESPSEAFLWNRTLTSGTRLPLRSPTTDQRRLRVIAMSSTR